jgi:restriction endonuclease
MILFYNYPKKLNNDQKRIKSLSFVFIDIIRQYKDIFYCFCSFFNTVFVFFYEYLQRNGHFFRNKTM